MERAISGVPTSFKEIEGDSLTQQQFVDIAEQLGTGDDAMGKRVKWSTNFSGGF